MGVNFRKKPITKNTLIAMSLFAGILLFQRGVYAQEPLLGAEKILDARGVSLGGAMRASPSSIAGIYLNPATIAMAHVYHINIKYQYTGYEEMHDAGIGFLDSITSPRFAAGLSLDFLRSDQAHSDFQSWDGRLAIATGFAQKFFVGMTGRYVRVSGDLESGDLGPNGPSAMPASGSLQLNAFTFDAGVAAALGKYIGLGLVGYNLTNTGSIYAPIELGGGLSINVKEQLLLETDVVLDFTSYDDVGTEFQFGAELFIKQVFSIRGGYIHDFHFDINTMCAGLGYSHRHFAIDFGYKQDIENYKRFRLAFGFRVFIS